MCTGDLCYSDDRLASHLCLSVYVLFGLFRSSMCISAYGNLPALVPACLHQLALTYPCICRHLSVLNCTCCCTFFIHICYYLLQIVCTCPAHFHIFLSAVICLSL
ncbi:uncharacterized protein F5147DRAFT_723470 [Suillus discolor]|uniref:Uncharacterized protein n=1 Tax=Suillus discolor TaxID=1912936 RepID=A0A9P7EW32_9AGAM|nr:uncharacterized protein F5147DRAFT_723470 [Suillus discolor]KAG2091488.1 hypothetical protein F5147DRAFT_723470 [Suillus discolor]